MMTLLFSIYCSLVIIAGAFFSWFQRETIATRCILFGGLVIVAAIKLRKVRISGEILLG
ncbi:hypothetical protein L1K23_21320 [Escherichia coli]|uniref:hypothetical protein n=1 Tax=Escherichia coli TaxID=562 RepID=UPI001F48545A|nr:hypothetical protein [Escherichia coli]MCF1981772.1 hypothetical protein [Escherichia coli]